jgi:hypothetical protein
MSDPVSWLVIERGWHVVAADGRVVGHVHDVLGDPALDIFDGLSVSTSAVRRPRYVSAEHVGAITVGTVTLTIELEQFD